MGISDSVSVGDVFFSLENRRVVHDADSQQSFFPMGYLKVMGKIQAVC